MEGGSSDFLECSTLGRPLYRDSDGKVFYAGVSVHAVTVRVGDFVRVRIEEGGYSFCQILAIFEHPDPEEGIMIEARWFYHIGELEFAEIAARIRTAIPPSELIETDILDDIPAGSIVDVIRIVTSGKRSMCADKQGEEFICRYLKESSSKVPRLMAEGNISIRGFEYSDYKHCYSTYLRNFEKMKANEVAVDIYSKAIQQLHISVIPVRLPCREAEQLKIEEFLKKAIVAGGEAKPFYVSGMPGTGKTAAVLSSIRDLHNLAAKRDLPEFQFVEINCLRLQSAQDAYVTLWKALSGQYASCKLAKDSLNQYFASCSSSRALSRGSSSNSSDKAKIVTVLLLDEIDFLLTRNEAVIYDFFDWPQRQNSGLVVIGIANVMDLPERLTQRVQSRLGKSLDRIVFPPYSHKQIQEILSNRLSVLDSNLFQGMSLDFLSRKAATLSGDLRLGLKICQRAIEIARYKYQDVVDSQISETSSAIVVESGHSNTSSSKLQKLSSGSLASSSLPLQMVTTSIIVAAYDEFKEDAFCSTIRNAGSLDKAILVCISRHLKATADPAFTLQIIWERLQDLIAELSNNRIRDSIASSNNIAGGDSVIASSSGGWSVLIMPGYHVFEEAFARMLDNGLFVLLDKRAATVVPIPRLFRYSLRPASSEITVALTGTPFFTYL